MMGKPAQVLIDKGAEVEADVLKKLSLRHLAAIHVRQMLDVNRIKVEVDRACPFSRR